MTETDNGSPQFPAPIITLEGFVLMVAQTPNGDKVLIMRAGNGALEYHVPMQADLAREVGTKLVMMIGGVLGE